MRHIIRQLFITSTFLGGWVLLLLALYLAGIQMPHTRAFAGIGRFVKRDDLGAPKAAEIKTSPTWYLPEKLKICLPNRIYAAAGVETSLYYDNLVLTDVPDGLRCEVTCVNTKVYKNLGCSERRRWTITPTAADVGDHIVKVAFKDVNPKGDQRPLAEGEFTLSIVPQDAGQNEKTSLLILGDSITHITTWVNALAGLLSAPGNPSWKMRGTNNPPQSLPGVCHEGYGGFVWGDFLTLYAPGDKTRPYRDISPFVFKNAGQLPGPDLPRYIREHCDNAPPQFVIFELGSNNVFGLPEDQPEVSGLYIEKMAADAEELLQAWRRAAPNAKLGILVPAQFSPYDLVYVHNYNEHYNHRRYRQNHFLYAEMMMKKFGGRESDNIFVIRSDACFDPIDGYPIDNASHPNEFGSSQYAVSAYSWMKWCLAARQAADPSTTKP